MDIAPIAGGSRRPVASLPGPYAGRVWIGVTGGANNSRNQADGRTRARHPAVIVPVVPGAAHHRQADPALVRWDRGRVDDLSGVLPVGIAARVHVRALAH